MRNLLIILLALALGSCTLFRKTNKETQTRDSTATQTATVQATEKSQTVIRERGTVTRPPVDTTIKRVLTNEPIIFTTPDVTVVATRRGEHLELRTVLPAQSGTYERETRIDQTKDVEATARSELKVAEKQTASTETKINYSFSWWWLLLLFLLLLFIWLKTKRIL